jgi:hypothetical protein
MQFPRPKVPNTITGNSGPAESAALMEGLGLFLESVSRIADSLDMISLYYEKKGRLEGLITDADFLPDKGGTSGK